LLVINDFGEVLLLTTLLLYHIYKNLQHISTQYLTRKPEPDAHTKT